MNKLLTKIISVNGVGMIRLYIFLITFFVLFGCSSSRVVVERTQPAKVSLNKESSIEIQAIEGDSTNAFRASVSQYLQENTSFKVIHHQALNELVEGRMRGQANRQTYQQADYIIRGSIIEVVDRSVGPNGETQYMVTSKPFLNLIQTTTGEVILSRQFIGTGISTIRPRGSFSPDNGYSDAVLSARRVALDKFVKIFQPSQTWMEIDLFEFSDKKKFSEVKNLIEASQYDLAILKAKAYQQTTHDEEKGKVTFCLAVIESLAGNFTRSKELLIQANELFHDRRIMEYLNRIESMKAEMISFSKG
ncbi:MAG: hypothetical protein K2P81_11385 [Bacteriovoracaceae bacterium]|nr:hypothetical protein [Bacteriovoracaceae bacterium]